MALFYCDESRKMMARKIYVDGGMLILTPLFTSSKIVAGCGSQPDGTELMTPKTQVDGFSCLIVDDEHPQSLFDAFYVRDFVSSGTVDTPYYSQTYKNIYEQFQQQISEIETLLNANIGNASLTPLLNKLCYVNLLSILDSYICSCVVSCVTHDEAAFLKYYSKMIDAKRQAKLSMLLINREYGKWEKEIIKEDILGKSFLNQDRVLDTFKLFNWKCPNINSSAMKEAIKNRHILVHRNGRRIDGSVIVVMPEMVSHLIIAIRAIALEINTTITSGYSNQE